MYLPLNRQHSRIIGLSLMVLGFFFSTPPGMISPDDFLNFFTAHKIIMPLFGVSFPTALFLTYTLVGWGLIILGAAIYPYSTKRLLTGKYHQLKAYILKTLKNPVLLLISIAIFILIFKLYYHYIVLKGGIA